MKGSPIDLNKLLSVVEMVGSLDFLQGVCKTVEEMQARICDFKSDLGKKRRELAKKYHPDRKGGSIEKMQEINSAIDTLLLLELQIRRPQPVTHFYYCQTNDWTASNYTTGGTTTTYTF